MGVAMDVKTVKARRAVEEMPEYHPPLAGRDGLRLDFNENTFAPSPRVMERIREITAAGLTKYPEREPAERKVAAHFGLEPEQVLLTNGVDEAIHLLCVAYLEPGDAAIIATPGFFMYDVSICMMGAKLTRVQADATLQFPAERFLQAVKDSGDRLKLIMVASPNNPTGAVVSRDVLLQICAAAPHAVVMVDEAYFHFHGETLLADVAHVPNLIVARTFSKAYGLANLRIGMLAGNADVMKYARKVSSPYNVNGVALDCLQTALEDTEYVAWYCNQVHTGRKRVQQRLTEMAVPFWPSHANFVLMNIGPKHADLVKAMRRRNVLLRDRSADPGLDGCVRITIGVAEQVEQGLTALKDSLAEIGWIRN